MIYLDHNATTPVDARVLEAMLPYFRHRFGNAASTHVVGRSARASVDAAREQLAALLGVRPSAVVWTSGATESLNTILKGLAAEAVGTRTKIVYGATEHKAVLDTLDAIATSTGIDIVAIPASCSGQLQIEGVQELVDDRTLAVCVMAANNETGAMTDVARVADIAHAAGVVVICDATQQAGKLPLALGEHVDFAAVSAHKFYGPQGVGALIAVNNDVAFPRPLIHGGGHQGGLRSGTLNVPGIVGCGAAAEIAAGELEEEAVRLTRLRDRLERLIQMEAGRVTVHSREAVRLPNTTNLRLHGVDADALIVNCSDVAFSSGSACTSSVPAPSHVLTAMGVAAHHAEESIRLSLGRFTTQKEIDEAAQLIGVAAAKIREANS